MGRGLLLGVFEINDVVLDQRVVFHLLHVKHELPGHGVFRRLHRQVHEVRHALVGRRLRAVRLHWDFVAPALGQDGLLVQLIDFAFCVGVGVLFCWLNSF